MACAQGEPPNAARDASLKQALSERIATWKSEGKLSDAAVYYRDLHMGAALGVNADIDFVPASLMKLPLAIAYFALGAEQPSFLQGEITYAPQQVRDGSMLAQNESADSGLKVGTRYPVETLLRAAVTTSDNLAYYLVVQHVNDQRLGPAFRRILREMGIVDPRTITEEVATPRGYGTLFRELYTASYLDVATSQKVLSWLSESSYDKGVAAGVPAGVSIANKFGERDLGDGRLQLHDCGIVYHPERPYVLCVMTKGRNFAQLQDSIAELSRTLYTAVDSRAL